LSQETPACAKHQALTSPSCATQQPSSANVDAKPSVLCCATDLVHASHARHSTTALHQPVCQPQAPARLPHRCCLPEYGVLHVQVRCCPQQERER
jgi:hypothetical protein